MIELEKIACSNCGAPLEVPDSVDFVTCNHCTTQLSIRRTESVSYTEKLEQVTADQAQLRERLVDLERQNRLATLARNWERHKKQYEIHKDGKTSMPSEVGGIVGMIMGAVIGIFIAIAAPGPMKLFGLLFFAVGVIAGLRSQSLAKQYNRDYRNYRRSRKEILAGKHDSDFNERLKSVPTPREYLEQLEEDVR
ncbi:hypothetical protein [Roseimaritima ulvae]|uniref:Uncharacterized protein n=1 Tax=Roseimaritima ulvae TaxID=980254 RepID=A0A5B9QL73_9BACT|nr:hypothetical protein [Roseimaritima ulvae]QEG38320.1 hypothetical protein UC8_02770 [Roseimaritima ulvae]